MPIASRGKHWTVWLCDETARAAVPNSRAFRIVRSPRSSSIRNLFVFCTAVHLPQVSPLVSAVNRQNQLLALFLREDADSTWLPQMLDRAKLRAVRNLLVHSNLELPRRVLTAWLHGAEDKLIARAMVAEDRLFVTSCVPETFEIEFERVPALKSLPKRERPNFLVSDDGSYIHWPSKDVHLSLDAIRSVIDPTYGHKCAAANLARSRNYGFAVATLRKQHGLRQADVAGLSERQVRRIESGEQASVSALKKLAVAHDLEFGDYLDVLADLS